MFAEFPIILVQRFMGGNVVGLNFNGLFITGDGRWRIALLIERVGHIVMHFGNGRVEPQGLDEPFDRLAGPLGQLQRHTHIVDCLQITRLDCQRRLVILYGLVVFLKLLMHNPQRVQAVHVSGIQVQSGGQRGAGLIQQAHCCLHQAQVAPGLLVILVQGYGLRINLQRVFIAPLAGQQIAQIVQHMGLVGRHRQRPQHQALGFRLVAFLAMDQPQELKGVRLIGINHQCLPAGLLGGGQVATLLGAQRLA